VEEDHGAFGVGCEEDGVWIVGQDREFGLGVWVGPYLVVLVGVLVPHFVVATRLKVIGPVWE
jgi:hypothetical protein